jgi:hypothetical protein
MTAPSHISSASCSVAGRLPRWQVERRRRLTLICSAIAANKMAGRPIKEITRDLAQKYNGHPLADGKHLRASAKTLTRLFIAWRKVGPAAFDLHFNPNPTRVPRKPRRRLQFTHSTEQVVGRLLFLAARCKKFRDGYRSLDRNLKLLRSIAPTWAEFETEISVKEWHKLRAARKPFCQAAQRIIVACRKPGVEP